MHRVPVEIVAVRGVPALGGLRLRRQHDLLVDRGPLRPQEFAHRLDLLVGDPGAVHAQLLVGPGRHVDHVAATEELLGAVAVEHRARVDLRGNLEGNACREIGLDEAGDDVDRRALGRDDQVDADGSRDLRQPHQRRLHLTRRDHHEICQLIDDDDPVRQLLLRRDGLVVALDVAHLLELQRLVALVHLADDPA